MYIYIYIGFVLYYLGDHIRQARSNYRDKAL